MIYYGLTALLNIVCNFIFVFLAFYCVQALRLDRYISAQKQGMFKILIILVSIAVGYLCSSFFLDFINNVRNLSYLFQK